VYTAFITYIDFVAACVAVCCSMLSLLTCIEFVAVCVAVRVAGHLPCILPSLLTVISSHYVLHCVLQRVVLDDVH